jgi:hypothetical protein
MIGRAIATNVRMFISIPLRWIERRYVNAASSASRGRLAVIEKVREPEAANVELPPDLACADGS